jgi:hypothetical protein
MREGLITAWCGVLCMACGSLEGPLLHETFLSDGSVEGDAGPSALPIQQDMSWQYQLTGEVDLDLDVELFVIDLFEADAADIARLHVDDKLVVAYLSAGTRESFRSDAGEFPDSAVGNTHADYPNEAWLDVRDEGVRAVMAERMAIARDKGFDGVFPTNLTGYQSDTGFDLSAADQRAYSEWLSSQAHARGMLVGLSDDFAQAGQLVASFDWAIHFGCIERGDCDQTRVFADQGKPVFDIETNGEPAEICAQADALGLNVLLKRPQLDAYRVGCL